MTKNCDFQMKSQDWQECDCLVSVLIFSDLSGQEENKDLPLVFLRS